MADTALKYTTTDGGEIYYSEIHAALDEYIQNAKQEAAEEGETFSMYKANQSRWNAALIYIYNTVFKNTDKLFKHNNKPYLYPAYNLDIVNDICDLYISLCLQYGKEISITGFSLLTGISSETIYQWGDNNNKNCQLSSKSVDIFKKIYHFREESLSDKLVSSGQALGVLGVLNHHYGWSTEKREVVHRVEVTDPGAIAARYGVQITQQDAPEV